MPKQKCAEECNPRLMWLAQAILRTSFEETSRRCVDVVSSHTRNSR
jgi:hypothetical protein